MEVIEAVRSITNKTIERLILSRPMHKETNPYRKVMIRPVLIRKEKHFQLEKFTDKQAFHENILPEALPEKLTALLTEDFGQLDGWAKEATILVRVNKKGNVLYRENKIDRTAEEMTAQDHETLFSQNREKNYLYEAKDAPKPLVDLGVISKDGKIIQDQYAKYRQINRFVELIEDGINGKDHLNIIDFGCGKSYLTFVVYDYLTRVKKMDIRMTGLDLKEDVIRHCNEIAKKYGYDHLTFEVGDINGYDPKEKVDMVISLHACDTATDFALYNAISWRTPLIYSVPCCQHEVNQQLSKNSLGTISQSGLLKERFAAILTDAVRADILRGFGYQTDVLEFVDMAFSPKNVMLRASKEPSRQLSEKAREEAWKRVEEAVTQYHVEPTLYRLCKKSSVVG